jgi:hypothetical protein
VQVSVGLLLILSPFPVMARTSKMFVLFPMILGLKAQKNRAIHLMRYSSPNLLKHRGLL